MGSLVFPLGGHQFDYKSWDNVVDLFGPRLLVQWKTCHLLMEGRLVLIKSNLCSISIFSMSVKCFVHRFYIGSRAGFHGGKGSGG